MLFKLRIYTQSQLTGNCLSPRPPLKDCAKALIRNHNDKNRSTGNYTVTKKWMLGLKLSYSFFLLLIMVLKRKRKLYNSICQTACSLSLALCNLKYLSSYNILEKHGIQSKYHRHTVQNISLQSCCQVACSKSNEEKKFSLYSWMAALEFSVFRCN